MNTDQVITLEVVEYENHPGTQQGTGQHQNQQEISLALTLVSVLLNFQFMNWPCFEAKTNISRQIMT